MNLIGNAVDALEMKPREFGTGAIGPGSSSIEATLTSEKIAVKQENLDRSTGYLIPNVPSPSIRIHTQMLDAKTVGICIADNGHGIPKDLISNIFNPFFTTKPVGRGTGLGLSISYQIIVEKHQGVLKCVSVPGQGTEFWIEIPVN